MESSSSRVAVDVSKDAVEFGVAADGVPKRRMVALKQAAQRQQELQQIRIRKQRMPGERCFLIAFHI